MMCLEKLKQHLQGSDFYANVNVFNVNVLSEVTRYFDVIK